MKTFPYLETMIKRKYFLGCSTNPATVATANLKNVLVGVTRAESCLVDIGNSLLAAAHRIHAAADDEKQPFDPVDILNRRIKK